MEKEKVYKLIMGVIYLISNTINEFKYVGQTILSSQERWKKHQYCANKLRRFQAGEIPKCKYQSYLYHEMVKLGIDNFEFTVIEDNLPNIELNDREINYIREYNTLRPLGYNSTIGGAKVYDEIVKLPPGQSGRPAKIGISETLIDIGDAKLDDILDTFITPENPNRKEESKGLPKYMVLHKKNTQGIAINKHPLCSYKSFALYDYGTLENCKIAACKFLEELERNKVPISCNKANPELPMGITIFRNGYLAKRKVNGIIYKKSFGDRLVDNSIKLQLAKDYLNSLPKQI